MSALQGDLWNTKDSSDSGPIANSTWNIFQHLGPPEFHSLPAQGCCHWRLLSRCQGIPLPKSKKGWERLEVHIFWYTHGAIKAWSSLMFQYLRYIFKWSMMIVLFFFLGDLLRHRLVPAPHGCEGCSKVFQVETDIFARKTFRQTLANPVPIFSGTCCPTLVRKAFVCDIHKFVPGVCSPSHTSFSGSCTYTFTFCFKMLVLASILTLPPSNYQGSPPT